MSTLSADEFESVFERLHQLSKTATFDIKTTEAQHYRRFVLQKKVAERREGIASVHVNVSPDAIGRAPRGLNDGKGFVFISHKGDVYPSGFLALAAGNIREQRLETIYCESLLFRGLRDTSMLEGKCGKCEFKEICGGSRSRSHVLTGNPYRRGAVLLLYSPRVFAGSESATETRSTACTPGSMNCERRSCSSQ